MGRGSGGRKDASLCELYRLLMLVLNPARRAPALFLFVLVVELEPNPKERLTLSL
jgi:hypothetical protein